MSARVNSKNGKAKCKTKQSSDEEVKEEEPGWLLDIG